MHQQQTVAREEKPRGQPENKRKDKNKQKEKFKDTSACLSTLALASPSIVQTVGNWEEKPAGQSCDLYCQRMYLDGPEP